MAPAYNASVMQECLFPHAFLLYITKLIFSKPVLILITFAWIFKWGWTPVSTFIAWFCSPYNSEMWKYIILERKSMDSSVLKLTLKSFRTTSGELFWTRKFTLPLVSPANIWSLRSLCHLFHRVTHPHALTLWVSVFLNWARVCSGHPAVALGSPVQRWTRRACSMFLFSPF